MAVERNPLFSLEGAARDEDSRLEASQYHPFRKQFKEQEGEAAEDPEKNPDRTRPGVRDGEEVPSGLKTWNDALGKSGKSGGMKNGAGWIAEYKGSKKQSQTRWFNVRTWGSWRLAFLLAKLQRQLWEAASAAPAKAAVEAPKVIAPVETAPQEAPASSSQPTARHSKGKGKGKGKGVAKTSPSQPSEKQPQPEKRPRDEALDLDAADENWGRLTPVASDEKGNSREARKRPAEEMGKQPESSQALKRAMTATSITQPNRRHQYRQCLDRNSGGISKGQVRKFIHCMASDLDLETKNGMVEALRLTEPNPTRLRRFVEKGGLMKLVFWMERALPEPGKEIHQFLDNSLRCMQVLGKGLDKDKLGENSVNHLLVIFRQVKERVQAPAPKNQQAELRAAAVRRVQRRELRAEAVPLAPRELTIDTPKRPPAQRVRAAQKAPVPQPKTPPAIAQSHPPIPAISLIESEPESVEHEPPEATKLAAEPTEATAAIPPEAGISEPLPSMPSRPSSLKRARPTSIPSFSPPESWEEEPESQQLAGQVADVKVPPILQATPKTLSATPKAKALPIGHMFRRPQPVQSMPIGHRLLTGRQRVIHAQMAQISQNQGPAMKKPRPVVVMPPRAVPPPKSVPSAKKARPSSVGEVELSEPEGPGEGGAASKDDTSGQEHLVEGEDAIEPAEGKVKAPFAHAPLGEESLRSATPKVAPPLPKSPMPKKILLPTPKTLSTPKMMPGKIEGANPEGHDDLEKTSTKVSDEATLQEEEWLYWQHQQELAEAVAPVPEMEVVPSPDLDQKSDWDSWEGQDWSEGIAAPVEPPDSDEGMVTDLEDVEMDVAADSESVHTSECDELAWEVQAATERVQELERNLMIPPDEESSDTEEEGQPHTLHPPRTPTSQGEADRFGREQQPEDPLHVIEKLGISPEALLVAPATPPRKPKSTETAAPRTPPLQPELSQEEAANAEALEKLCREMGAPGTPPRDPQSPGRGFTVSHPSSPVVIPTSAMKSEPEQEDSRFAKAKSFEELVQQSDPCSLQTDDFNFHKALQIAVLNSSSFVGAVPENPVEPHIIAGAGTMFQSAMEHYTDSVLMTTAATDLAESLLGQAMADIPTGEVNVSPEIVVQ